MSALTDLLAPNGAPLIAACTRYGIGSPLEQAYFFATCAVESAGFHKLSENLNYSTLGLLKTFHRYFTPQEAALYARQPEKIANRVYANRFGNGDEESGDGWRYRGRGDIGLTFKNNYQAASQRIYGDDRLVHDPDILLDPNQAAMAAGDFWIEHNVGLHAMHDDPEGVRRAVNGGLNGLDELLVWLQRFKLALGVPT